MGKFLTPILLIVITIALYFLWISPTYSQSQDLQTQHAKLADALAKEKEVQTLISQLQANLTNVPPDQLDRLKKMIPDNIDNIRLLIEINNVAVKNGMSISNLTIPPKPTSSGGVVGTNGYGTLTFGFTVRGTYDQLIIFLNAIAAELRLINISKLDFAVDDTSANGYSYTVTLDTYWLY